MEAVEGERWRPRRRRSATPSSDRATRRGRSVRRPVGIGWEGYRTMLRLRGERSAPEDDLPRWGSLARVALVLPRTARGAARHVRRRGRRRGLDIPCVPAGQTTFRRRKKRGGRRGGPDVLPRERGDRVRGKEEIDLRVDPPRPGDRGVYTHDAAPAIEVYRRLGCPRSGSATRTGCASWSGRRTAAMSKSETSLAFPFLTRPRSSNGSAGPTWPRPTEWIEGGPPMGPGGPGPESSGRTQGSMTGEVKMRRPSPSGSEPEVRIESDRCIEARRTAWRRSESPIPATPSERRALVRDEAAAAYPIRKRHGDGLSEGTSRRRVPFRGQTTPIGRASRGQPTRSPRDAGLSAGTDRPRESPKS